MGGSASRAARLFSSDWPGIISRLLQRREKSLGRLTTFWRKAKADWPGIISRLTCHLFPLKLASRIKRAPWMDFCRYFHWYLSMGFKKCYSPVHSKVVNVLVEAKKCWWSWARTNCLDPTKLSEMDKVARKDICLDVSSILMSGRMKWTGRLMLLVLRWCLSYLWFSSSYQIPTDMLTSCPPPTHFSVMVGVKSTHIPRIWQILSPLIHLFTAGNTSVASYTWK